VKEKIKIRTSEGGAGAKGIGGKYCLFTGKLLIKHVLVREGDCNDVLLK